MDGLRLFEKEAIANPEKHKQLLMAEQAVLGSLLIDDEIAPQLFATVKADDFFIVQNRQIFLAARSLFRNGNGVDIITVANALKGVDSKIVDVPNYLAQLMEITPTSANWKEYADIMREQSTLYRVKDIAQKIVSAATLDDIRPLASSLSDALSHRTNARVWGIGKILTSFLEYQDPDTTPANAEYLRYGIGDLDQGMYTQAGDVVIIGGYPSDGKTAWALSLAWTFSTQGKKVAFFSLETSLEKLRDRVVTHLSGIQFSRIKRRNLTEADWEHLAQNVPIWTANKNFFIVHADNMTASNIQAISRAYGFDVIFVDYIQLIPNETARYNAPRWEIVAEASRSMHNFAQSTGTTVFELSQLSRPVNGNGSRDPHMDSLRESGQLEQDADAVFLLFRKNPDETQDTRRILRIVKNKEGTLGSWYLDFDGSTQTFSLSVNQNVARVYSAAGRAAKNRNRMDAQESYYQASLDDSDMPF